MEKPRPLKWMPIALVLLVFCNFDITMAEPTTSAIAAPKPANKRAINQVTWFSVKANNKEVTIHKTKPNLKKRTLAWISLMKIAKIEPDK